TSLLLSGTNAKYSDSRIKAVVALSGPVNEKIFTCESENDLAAVKIPVLFEYGGKETAMGRNGDKSFLFEKANAPKLLICVKDADHLSFSGGVKGEFKLASDYVDKDTVRKTISETTLDFFDAYLKNEKVKKEKLAAPRP